MSKQKLPTNIDCLKTTGNELGKFWAGVPNIFHHTAFSKVEIITMYQLICGIIVTYAWVQFFNIQFEVAEGNKQNPH